MLILILFSLDLALLWFLAITFVMADEGNGSMFALAILLAAIVIVNLVAIIRGLFIVKRAIQNSKNHKS
jgi:Kef-type K+ transport system membrane component KefB